MKNTHGDFEEKSSKYNRYWKERFEINRTRVTEIHAKILSIVSRHASKGSKIIDLGVGPGHVFKKLQENHDTYGVEISKKAFELYDFDSSQIKQADLEKEIPTFESAPNFDFIIASHIIHHFKKPLSFLKMVNGKLSEDGKILIATPNTTFFNHRFRYFFFGQYPKLSPEHINFLTCSEYKKLFKEANLRIVEITGLEHYLFLSKKFPSMFSPTLFFVVEKNK